MREGEERCETMGRMSDTSGGEPVRMVALTVLAGEDYLALARTSAMHVGALLFFPLPRVNDLRLAVDEACSSFLRAAQESDVDVAAAGPAGTMGAVLRQVSRSAAGHGACPRAARLPDGDRRGARGLADAGLPADRKDPARVPRRVRRLRRLTAGSMG